MTRIGKKNAEITEVEKLKAENKALTEQVEALKDSNEKLKAENKKLADKK